jgi:hypothetical protein
MLRLSNSLNRVSIKIENFGFLVFLAAQAFISIGEKPHKRTMGSIKGLLFDRKKSLNTVEEKTDPLAWKIVIKRILINLVSGCQRI